MANLFYTIITQKKMKKQILLLSAIGMSSLVYSQVGVNTQTPQATLDVVGKNTDTTKPDGVIAPRLTGNELKAKDNAYGTAQTGAIVYATAAVSGSTPKTINVTSPGYYYYNGTLWTAFNGGGVTSGDPTKDAWIDNVANTSVELGTLSDGATARPAGTEVVVKDDGSIGVGTNTPQKKMHVNGALQITNELNLGGTASTAGSAGASGQVLLSGGAGVAPTWGSLNSEVGNLSGLIFRAYNIQGTTPATAATGQTVDVPGLVFTYTVPAGRTQTIMFTILGYAAGQSAGGQGVFVLLQDNVKISSAYVSKTNSSGGLSNLPIPVTFLKAVKLNPGTYTFKVQYKSWSGTATVNQIPTIYTGYDGDVEAQLAKMQVLVYND